MPHGVSVPLLALNSLPHKMMNASYMLAACEPQTRRPGEPVFPQSDRNALRTPPAGRRIRSCARWRGCTSEIIALPWIPVTSVVEIRGRWKDDTNQPGQNVVFSRFQAAPPALASLMSFAMETEVARGSRITNVLAKPTVSRFGDAPAITGALSTVNQSSRIPIRCVREIDHYQRLNRNLRTQVAAFSSD